MQPKTKRKVERFSNGILSVWQTEDHTLIKEKINNLAYGKEKISMMHQYHDQIAGEKTDKIVLVPPNPFIDENDIIVIEEKQFKIKKREEETVNQTKVIRLTLEESKVKYKEVENEN